VFGFTDQSDSIAGSASDEAVQCSLSEAMLRLQSISNAIGIQSDVRVCFVMFELFERRWLLLHWLWGNFCQSQELEKLQLPPVLEALKKSGDLFRGALDVLRAANTPEMFQEARRCSPL
jgi:hypothetical protein